MKSSSKLVLFDFDGVIADSFEQVITGIVNIAPKYNLPIKTAQDVRDLYNNNFYESVNTLGMTDEKITQFLNDSFWDSVIDGVKPAVGMPELIAQLSTQYPLIIVTSADLEWVSPFLRRYSLEKYFKRILSKESGLGKVEKIEKCVVDYGFVKENVFYVCDTTGDIEEARTAGVKTVAVTWGFHSKENLQEAKPDYLTDTVEKLRRILL